MANIDVTITNNKEEILNAFREQVQRGLEAIGSTAEGYAKENCPVDTGRLRNSITYATAEYGGVGTYSDDKGNEYNDASANATPEKNTLYIGTNVEYAPIQEFHDMKHKTGQAHFLRDSATTHGDEYQELMRASLQA